MQDTIIDMGGEGTPLLFAHANGYPPGSYRQLFNALHGHFHITAVEHRPLWAGREPPRRLRWRVFADDLLAVMERFCADPVWVMGHSMGATSAVLAAARQSRRFAGLILLDPVFLPERLVLATRLTPERRLRELPMIRKALSRPERFDDYESAFAFYRGKRAFRGLSDEALLDYVRASKRELPGGGVQLRYSGAWEAAVYATPPSIRRSLRRLTVPTLGFRGRDSDTLRPEVWARWHHWQPDAMLRELPGGHLFPLEHPQESAAAIIEAVFPE